MEHENQVAGVFKIKGDRSFGNASFVCCLLGAMVAWRRGWYLRVNIGQSHITGKAVATKTERPEATACLHWSLRQCHLVQIQGVGWEGRSQCSGSHFLNLESWVLWILFYWSPQLLRWLSGKECTCQYRRHRFDSWVRQIAWRRAWQPTPVFLPGESHGQRSLAGCSP